VSRSNDEAKYTQVDKDLSYVPAVRTTHFEHVPPMYLLLIPLAVRLRRQSAAARLLVSRVPIPLKAWMFVSFVCCVGSGLCDELITR
jgi:hypothetical protein